MPEKQNVQRTAPKSRPATKNASNTTFVNPADFGKKPTPVRERMEYARKKKSTSTKKPPVG